MRLVAGMMRVKDQFHNCTGVKDEVIQNVKVTYTPDPPQMGKGINITVTGNISELVAVIWSHYPDSKRVMQD